MVNDIAVDLEIDDNLNGILDITCPRCRSHIKKKLQNLGQGTDVTCTCGAIFQISNDGFRSAQRSLDQLKRTLSSFGK